MRFSFDEGVIHVHKVAVLALLVDMCRVFDAFINQLYIHRAVQAVSWQDLASVQCILEVLEALVDLLVGDVEGCHDHR